jgi:hypothetical protein
MYNSHYRVTTSQTNMFPWPQLNYNKEEQNFLCGPCRDVISRTIVGSCGWSVIRVELSEEMVGEWVSEWVS